MGAVQNYTIFHNSHFELIKHQMSLEFSIEINTLSKYLTNINR